MKAELFRTKEITRDQPIRPLGEVSTFVVEQFPQVLQQVRHGELRGDYVSDQIVELTQSVTRDRLMTLDPHLCDLAGLDLKMLELGLVHSKLRVPDALTDHVNFISDLNGQLPMMTYEEIVLINPASDIRTFTDGVVGASEADFYRGHALIETEFDRAIRQMIDAQSGVVAGAEIIPALVRQAAEQMDQVAIITRTIGQAMPRDHFAAFRGYLTTHPERKLSGPSGTFTAGLPVIELRFSHEMLEPDHLQYLTDNALYFPRSGRVQMVQAQTEASLVRMLQTAGLYEVCLPDLRRLSDSIRSFRQKHQGAIARQIPGALRGDTEGTGGQSDVKKFTDQRINISHLPS